MSVILSEHILSLLSEFKSRKILKEAEVICMQYCFHIEAGAVQFSLDFKWAYATFWLMSYFPSYNPFSTLEMLQTTR